MPLVTAENARSGTNIEGPPQPALPPSRTRAELELAHQASEGVLTLDPFYGARRSEFGSLPVEASSRLRSGIRLADGQSPLEEADRPVAPGD